MPKILKANRPHGLTKTAEYRSWVGMIERCEREKHRSWANYGGRGIRVCARWRGSFLDFLSDMGTKPSPSHSIERKNNNGNYTPDNCIWATMDVQQLNKRSARIVTLHGTPMPLTSACKILGVNRHMVWARLRNGWPETKALHTPKFGTVGQTNG